MTLAVIGAGFGRTGTVSLKMALEQLGFGPCCHGMDPRHFNRGTDFWQRIFDHRTVNWDEFFHGYCSTVDSPSCRVCLDLAAKFPSAKVILTVRDPHDWFESYQKTVLPLARTFAGGRYFRFLFGDGAHDRESIIAAYERHYAEVQRSLPPERLLVYSVADGWAPLCEFLRVPAPAAPFPRANPRMEFAATLDKVLMQLIT